MAFCRRKIACCTTFLGRHAVCCQYRNFARDAMDDLPYGFPDSLIPTTDKVSREPADHPDRIPADKRTDPITRRLRVLVRRSHNERPH